MERLEQIMGTFSLYAPPKVVHDLEDRIRKIMENEKQETFLETRDGVWEYLYQNGTLARPY